MCLAACGDDEDLDDIFGDVPAGVVGGSNASGSGGASLPIAGASSGGKGSTVTGGSKGTGAAGGAASGGAIGKASGGSSGKASGTGGSSGSPSGGSSGKGSGGTGGKASAGAGNDAGTAGTTGESCSESSYARPDLDTSCSSSNDCFAGSHITDCCGSRIWLGYNEAERAAFARFEADCEAAALCDCVSRPTRAEDGLETGDREAVPQCLEGRCIARHPDQANDCLSGNECLDVDNGSCIEATGPNGNGLCRNPGGFCDLCRCASPDTPVATPAGERPIAELRPGDLVYSQTGSAIVAVPILLTHREPVEQHEVVEVTLDTGRVLRVSAAHPTADGRSFAELAVGSALGDTGIRNVRRIPYVHRFTYEILPASETGTYFAAGVPIGSTLFAATRGSLSR
jgi:hypothetical protein